MKNAAILTVLIFGAIGISASLQNETKIGYVYVELVLNQMPETKEMNSKLDEMSKQKSEQLLKKTRLLNKKIDDMNSKERSGELTESGRAVSQKEIDELKVQIETQARTDEEELFQIRMKMLTPVAQKLEAAMDEVANEKGYKYVINSSDGTGNSIVVVAPEADDLTSSVMNKLGIKN